MLVLAAFLSFMTLPAQTALLPVEAAQCVVGADGVVVCGFGCAEAPGGRVLCAAEPGGVCAVDTDGVLRCSPPTGQSIRLPLLPATCVRGADGGAACGYACVVDGAGRAHCANTADGACLVSPGGRATCTRLPERNRLVLLNDVVAPQCQTDRDGDVVCGYACQKSAAGTVGCASTPDGACIVDTRGDVACTRFEAANRLYVGGPPQATCVRGARGINACGYGCVASTDGTARCSASPFGICARQTSGLVRCFPDDTP
jgi:hypothetical protein